MIKFFLFFLFHFLSQVWVQSSCSTRMCVPRNLPVKRIVSSDIIEATPSLTTQSISEEADGCLSRNFSHPCQEIPSQSAILHVSRKKANILETLKCNSAKWMRPKSWSRLKYQSHYNVIKKHDHQKENWRRDTTETITRTIIISTTGTKEKGNKKKKHELLVDVTVHVIHASITSSLPPDVSFNCCYCGNPYSRSHSSL